MFSRTLDEPVTAPVLVEDGAVRPAGGDDEMATGAGERAGGLESRGGRFRRKAHRTRLHLYALGSLAIVVFVIALALSNTGHVHVSWVFGSSSVALVWMVLFSAILGWLLGVLVSALFRWRTRAPRPS